MKKYLLVIVLFFICLPVFGWHYVTYPIITTFPRNDSEAKEVWIDIDGTTIITVKLDSTDKYLIVDTIIVMDTLWIPE